MLGLVERAGSSGIDCGTFKIDCSNAFGACNNACYWHNCIHGGNYLYRDDGEEDDEEKDDKAMAAKQAKNRAQSGQLTTSGYATCRIYPISQLMYDEFIIPPGSPGQNWDHTPLDLQADEWPMAAMTQYDYDINNPWPPRNSLRCIDGVQNGSM